MASCTVKCCIPDSLYSRSFESTRACGQVPGIGVTQKNAPSVGASAGAGLKPPTPYTPRMNAGVSITSRLPFAGKVTKSLSFTKAVAAANDCFADGMKVAARRMLPRHIRERLLPATSAPPAARSRPAP